MVINAVLDDRTRTDIITSVIHYPYGITDTDKVIYASSLVEGTVKVVCSFRIRAGGGAGDALVISRRVNDAALHEVYRHRTPSVTTTSEVTYKGMPCASSDECIPCTL